MNTLYFLDTETGGLDPDKHSLLSIAILGPIESYYWEINPDKFSATDYALKLNGFTKEYLEENGEEEANVAKDFLKVLTNIVSTDHKKIMLCGKNIQFDVDFLKRFCKKWNIDYHGFFDYRTVDLTAILTFLQNKGIIEDPNLSLEKAAEALEIETGVLHNALEDAILTKNIYEKLLTL